MIKCCFILLTLLGSVALFAQPKTFSYDGKFLAANQKTISNKLVDTYKAYTQLLKDADKSLAWGPVSVMEKTQLPPSGDKHDYMSLAPYFWPNPETANGLPYIRKDGETNPEVSLYKDKTYWPELCEQVFTLSLANYYSSDKKYATHAEKLLQVWFVDTATKMNPNLNYGQAIRGSNEGRGAGLIDTRHLVKLIEGVQLLKANNAISTENYTALQAWFKAFLYWMETSKNGRDEMAAKNNHGVWYDAQRLSIALFTQQNDRAKKIIDNVKNRINTQMNEEGLFPLELERTTSLHYSLFVVEPLFLIAQMASTVGVDLYGYTSPKGNSLKKAFDALYPYLTNSKKWAWPNIKEFDRRECFQLYARAATTMNCSTCWSSIQKIETEKYASLRVHLLIPKIAQ